MKKFIALTVALVSFGAMAQSKHMVTLSGYETGTESDRSLDLEHSTGSNNAGKNESTKRLNLNYAYAVTPSIQVGFNYKMSKKLTSGDLAAAGDESTSYGLQAIYNFAGQLSDTHYVAVKYDMMKAKESDTTGNDGSKTNVWSLEAGHRFSMGTIWGMNFNYSPSATLALSSTEYDAAQDDTSRTALTLNFVKFDVLF